MQFLLPKGRYNLLVTVNALFVTATGEGARASLHVRKGPLAEGTRVEFQGLITNGNYCRRIEIDSDGEPFEVVRSITYDDLEMDVNVTFRYDLQFESIESEPIHATPAPTPLRSREDLAVEFLKAILICPVDHRPKTGGPSIAFRVDSAFKYADCVIAKRGK